MDKQKAKELFESCDKNGSGYVDRTEFVHMMLYFFELKEDDEQISNLLDDIFTMVDGKGLFNRKDGKLNFNEFYKVVSLIPNYYVAPIRSLGYVLFNLVDKNSSGDVSKKEIKSYFDKIGVGMKSKELNKFIEKLDRDNDSVISFDEFMKLFTD